VRIPINAAKSFLSLIYENEYQDVSRAVLGRLKQIDLDMSFLKESIIELTQVQGALFGEEPNIKDWPGLSGEFAALVSWLMQDLKTSMSSHEFDKAVNSATLRDLHSLGVIGPYPPELKVKVHHWVVGACWTDAADRASTLVFPMRPLSMDKEEPGIAYNGLIRHMQMLEALGLDDYPATNSELAVSSIALRVVGLAESLNPEFEKNAPAALSRQLGSKFGSEGVKTPIKVEVEKKWNTAVIKELVDFRNTIAHLSSRETGTFSKTIEAFSRERVYELSKLASTLMASEVLFRLESVSEVKVKQWLGHFKRQLEDQNLNPLESGRAMQFKDLLDTKYQSYLDTGSPSQLVTPLG
jgi:hypothetical protein